MMQPLYYTDVIGENSRAVVDRQDGNQVVDDLVAALLTASRVLVGVSAASLAEVEETVTLTQFRALVVLDRFRGGSPTDAGSNLNSLAESLGVNPSTAMRTVDRLIAAGMVTRAENPTNRREVRLTVTHAGSEVVRTVTARRRDQLARIVQRMPGGSRRDLITALSDFAEAAGEPPASHSAPLGW